MSLFHPSLTKTTRPRIGPSSPFRARTALATLIGACVAPALAWGQTAPSSSANDVVEQDASNTGSAEPPSTPTKPPTLIGFVDALLPADAPALERDDHVLLSLTVQLDGATSDVVVEEGIDAVRDAAALAAARQFVFAPAELDGAPVAVRIRYEFRFAASPLPEPSASPQEQPTPPPPAAATGALDGVVLESGSRDPLIGARVQVPALGLETLTDANGHFRFEQVPVGSHALAVLDVGHQAIEDKVEVRAKAVTSLEYFTPASDFESSGLFAVSSKPRTEVTVRELSAREIQTLPGSAGDALSATRNLPGVARTTNERLVLRGETGGLALVNGHPISLPFHFNGVRSTVNSALIETLLVKPGNYDARYGNTNAGVIEITTRRPAGDRFHGTAELNVFDAGLFVEGPVSEHATLALGGRRSYIDGILSFALPSEDRDVFQVAPRYYDFQGVYDWKKGGHRVRVNALGSSDRIELLLKEPAEADPTVRGKLGQHLNWYTGQLLWDYTTPGTQVSNGVSWLRADFSAGLGGTLGGNYDLDTWTLRHDTHHELFSWLRVRAGVHGVVESTSFIATAPKGNSEGDPPAVLAPLDLLTTRGEGWRVLPAVYAGFEAQWGPFTLAPAVRVEHFSRRDTLEGDTRVQPRIDARLALGATTTLRGAFGIYSRVPDFYQLDDVFGSPTLKPEMSHQYSLGIEQRLGDATTFTAVGFYKYLYDQVSAVEDPTINFDSRGQGRAYGGEFLLKHDDGRRLYGWIAYTVQRSERKESGQADYDLFAYDQTHNLNIVAQYRLTPTWEVGGRFRYVIGSPTTPVLGATYDSDADIYTPLYGRLNSARVDAFHQLDVRVDKHWVFDTWKLTTYLDLQNVYNRQNPETISYNFNYTRSKANTGANLPFIPAFGLRGEF